MKPTLSDGMQGMEQTLLSVASRTVCFLIISVMVSCPVKQLAMLAAKQGPRGLGTSLPLLFSFLCHILHFLHTLQ